MSERCSVCGGGLPNPLAVSRGKCLPCWSKEVSEIDAMRERAQSIEQAFAALMDLNERDLTAFDVLMAAHDGVMVPEGELSADRFTPAQIARASLFAFYVHLQRCTSETELPAADFKRATRSLRTLGEIISAAEGRAAVADAERVLGGE